MVNHPFTGIVFFKEPVETVLFQASIFNPNMDEENLDMDSEVAQTTTIMP